MPHRTAIISPATTKTAPGGLRAAGKRRPELPVMLGILEVFVDSARKLRRPNPLARRMDPWIKLSLGRETHATFIDKKGGRHPVFGQYFSFAVFAHTRILRVECFDKSRIGFDSMIGYGAIELDAYLPASNCGTQWFNLVHGGIRHAGQVQMHMAFYPKDASKLGKIHPPRLALTPVCVNWDAIVAAEKQAPVVVAPVAAAVRIVSNDVDEMMDSGNSLVEVPRCASPVLKDSDSAFVSSRRNSTSSIVPAAARRQSAGAALPLFSTDMIQLKLWQTAQALDSTSLPLVHLTASKSSSASSRQDSDMDSVYSFTTDSAYPNMNGFDRYKHEPGDP